MLPIVTCIQVFNVKVKTVDNNKISNLRQCVPPRQTILAGKNKNQDEKELIVFATKIQVSDRRLEQIDRLTTIKLNFQCELSSRGCICILFRKIFKHIDAWLII